MIQRLTRAAGVSKGKHGAHRMRHTFATNFLRNGGKEAVLQQALGHSTREMTQRYVSSLGEDDLISSHQTASPADKWLK